MSCRNVIRTTLPFIDDGSEKKGALSSQTEQAEEAAREQMEWGVKLFEWVWKRGFSGKLAITLLMTAVFGPFAFDLLALSWLIWAWFALANLSLTERLSIIGLVVLTAKGLAVWVIWFVGPNLAYLYLKRRRRRKAKEVTPPSIR